MTTDKLRELTGEEVEQASGGAIVRFSKTGNPPIWSPSPTKPSPDDVILSGIFIGHKPPINGNPPVVHPLTFHT